MRTEEEGDRVAVSADRRQLVQLMQQYTRLKDEATEEDLGLSLVVDAEIFRLDSLIRWLDAVDGRLKRSPVAAPATRSAKSAPERLRRRIGTTR